MTYVAKNKLEFKEVTSDALLATKDLRYLIELCPMTGEVLHTWEKRSSAGFESDTYFGQLRPGRYYLMSDNQLYRAEEGLIEGYIYMRPVVGNVPMAPPFWQATGQPVKPTDYDLTVKQEVELK